MMALVYQYPYKFLKDESLIYIKKVIQELKTTLIMLVLNILSLPDVTK